MIDQTLEKLAKVIEDGEKQMVYASESIKLADELLRRSAFKSKPLHVEYYQDDDGTTHALALDKTKRGNYRLFYEEWKEGTIIIYKPLIETKVQVRARMLEYLPDFLEKFMQLPFKNDTAD